MGAFLSSLFRILRLSRSRERVSNFHYDEGTEGDDGVDHFLQSLAGETDEILGPRVDFRSIEDMDTYYRAVALKYRMYTVPEDDVISPTNLLTLNEAIDLPTVSRNNDRQAYPYRRFIIVGWNMAYADFDNDGGRGLSIDQFFEKWGTSMRTLTLESCNWCLSLVGANAILSEMKNLTCLILKNCNAEERTQNQIILTREQMFRDIRPANCYPIEPMDMPDIKHLVIIINESRVKHSWKMLERFPNLTQLTVSVTNSQAINGISKRLKKYREHNELLHVTIHAPVHFEGTIGEFLKAALPLEEMTAHSIGNGFQQKLAAMATKLGQLNLRETINGDFMPAFPFHIEFPVLKKLRVEGKVTNSFNFLKFMPSLEQVIITLDLNTYILQLEDENPVKPIKAEVDFVGNMLDRHHFAELLYLTHLEIDCYFEPGSLKILHNMTPKLKTLTMILDNKSLRIVCEKWVNLSHLTLHSGSQVDDNGITGWKLNDEDETEQIRHPNLTSLKKLRSFRIMQSTTDIILTDVSASDAFLCMPSLKTLCIETPIKLSRAREEMLRKQINHVCSFPKIIGEEQSGSEDNN